MAVPRLMRIGNVLLRFCSVEVLCAGVNGCQFAKLQRQKSLCLSLCAGGGFLDGVHSSDESHVLSVPVWFLASKGVFSLSMVHFVWVFLCYRETTFWRLVTC